MIKRLPRALSRLFYIVFSLCFAWLLNHIVTRGWYGYREVPILFCIVCTLLLLVLFWRLIMKYENALEKRSFEITTVFLAVMLVVQIVNGYLLRYDPVFDVDAIYGGAVEWAETGSFPSYYEYFEYFFNNFGGLRFFYCVFSLSRALGWQDYYMAAVTVNSLLSLCTMFLTGDVCRRLLGARGRFMAYALFLVSPPFYFIAPAFYTDALAMPFPILAYWLYLLAKETDNHKMRAVIFALMGLSGAVGILIKPVVAIVFIAILIDAVLTWDWKRAILIAIIVFLFLLACSAGLYSTIYRHLDRDEAENNRTPLLHWVMMGLKGDGMYNPGDYEFTRSFDDKEEQKAALLDEIGIRIKDRGLNGMVSLFTTKSEICFGDGTYGLEDCLGGIRDQDSKLHEWILSEGRHYSVYKHICTGVLLALYVLIIISGLQEVLCTGSDSFQYLAPRLAVFGLLLFLMCWEARWRYFSSFIPMIFVSALLGIDTFSNLLQRIRCRMIHRKKSSLAETV